MANAVTATYQGADYQARWFWIAACRMFEPHTKVNRVGYDLDTRSAPKGFDDIAVFYESLIPDGTGGVYTAEYQQVKYHVDNRSMFTYESLTDPAFIGAESCSLLQRLINAQNREGSQRQAIYTLISPSPIKPDDQLCRLIAQGGELRLEVLLEGQTGRSAMGAVRECWRKHLGLSTDEELLRVLRPLRIRVNAGNMGDVRERLNYGLLGAGLKPIHDDKIAFEYDELIKKLRVQGRCEFTRAEIEAVCKKHDLWCGRPAQPTDAILIGVRSFMRWAEHMEDETQHMLCLQEHFDGRVIRQNDLWHEAIYPKLAEFVTATLKPDQTYHLHIDAHSTIAFAAGYNLDPKSGVRALPVQKTRGKGSVVWDPTIQSEADCEEWEQTELTTGSAGRDIALAISATHDITEDVRLCVEHGLPEVGRIVALKLGGRPGQCSVRDGSHAVELAQSLASILKSSRSSDERRSRLHIFAAVPNALMYFIGQHARGFGALTLYEYDFDANLPGEYHPSLSFPPVVAVFSSIG